MCSKCFVCNDEWATSRVLKIKKYASENSYARCMLKQLFTSVSVNSVDIYLASSRLHKYLPLFSSVSVNNCSIFKNRAGVLYGM